MTSMSDAESGGAPNPDPAPEAPFGAALPPAGGAAPEAEQEAPAPPEAISNPAARFFLTALLALTTVAMLWAVIVMIGRVEAALDVTTEVQWAAPPTVQLKPGPTAFRHDVQRGVLVCRGRIDDRRKEALLELLEVEEPADAEGGETPDVPRAYGQAIDQLAFASNTPIAGLTGWIMLLGGIGGMIGAQTRSIWLFIRIACYQNRLELKLWWPWYVLRPLLGFVLGAFVFVLAEADLLAMDLPGRQANGGAMWWLAVSFIVGFGTQEFVNRLRELTNTLFRREDPSK